MATTKLKIVPPDWLFLLSMIISFYSTHCRDQNDDLRLQVGLNQCEARQIKLSSPISIPEPRRTPQWRRTSRSAKQNVVPPQNAPLPTGDFKGQKEPRLVGRISPKSVETSFCLSPLRRLSQAIAGKRKEKKVIIIGHPPVGNSCAFPPGWA